MRRILAVAVVIVLVTPAYAREPWHPGMTKAINYAGTRSGTISFAVMGPAGRIYGYRRESTAYSASVIKVMFMAAYLRHPSVRDRKLHDSDRQLLGPMIKRSDNASASRVAGFVGPDQINRLAADARMQDFSYVVDPWGESVISSRDQVRFMFNLDRYIPERHEDYARYLLSHIVKSQRWGIARLNRPNWRLFFKGGWGSGTGWADHQIAFLERGGKRIAVAILIMYSPSHEYGKETLKGIADRLLNNLPVPN